MSDPYASAKQMFEFQKGNVPEFYKWAKNKWETFTRESKSVEKGHYGKCLYNAYQAVERDHTLKMYIGYGIDASIPIPFKHAWVVDANNVVHDCTPEWADKEKVYYYGVHVPFILADMIFKYEEHTGRTPSVTNDFFFDMEWALEKRQEQIRQSLTKTTTANFASWI